MNTPKYNVKGQEIGFLKGTHSAGPFTSPGFGGPFGGHNPGPGIGFGSGPIPPIGKTPFLSPFQKPPGPLLGPGPAASSPGGLSGLLQGIMGGKGQLDLGSVISNAQKMIGIVNQVGPIVRNLSPMLHMLKGLSALQGEEDEENIPDSLSETEVMNKPSKKKKRKRRRRRRYSRQKRKK
jgi:hypothetical protein